MASGDRYRKDSKDFTDISHHDNIMGRMVYGKMKSVCRSFDQPDWTDRLPGPLINDETRRLGYLPTSAPNTAGQIMQRRTLPT